MSNRIYGLKKDSEDARDYLYSPAALKLPKSLDLRSRCPRVYDQGSQGSCTAHAGCACRTMLANNKQLDLARAFLYYQTRLLENTVNKDSGASIRDTCRAVAKYGVCKSALMPYKDSDYQTAPSAAALKNGLGYRIASYEKLSGVTGVKQALYERKQPVVVGMTVFESMESAKVAKTGVLPMPQSNETVLGYHAVLVVGYSDAKAKGKVRAFLSRLTGKKESASAGYFIVRNSWGSKWGMKGYFRMPYEFLSKYGFDFWIMKK